jgi:uncharacterized surface protein with fasciclin (FAS1) repeats
MRNYVRTLTSVTMVVFVLFFAACSTEDNAGANPAPNPNIAQIIAQDQNFSILNAAVNRAGLSSALATNNITLFAPDNTAFAASGITDVNAVPEATLRSILNYHVVPRRISGTQIPSSDTLKTLNLQNLYTSNSLNGSYVNGVDFRRKDMEGSNGKIHVMTKVLLPPAPNKSIASVVANDTTFSFLLRAITRLNLLALFNDPNKLTVYAPTNAAFRLVGITDVNAVPLTVLDAVLKQHVLVSNFFISDLTDNGVLPTSFGGVNHKYGINRPGGVYTVMISGSSRPASQMTSVDIICTNGVVHVINRVLLQ